ncbi:MAG: FG-GAP-like repeat-containing protein, partial [Thermoanaerobaculia bacterium]|nr:FG-GAP-like repeat-containing protein [Thermoanaerobaculia bacterium]
QGMARALELVAQRVDDSGANPFAPRARIEYMRRLEPPGDPAALLAYRYQLGWLLLLAGRTDEAIRELEAAGELRRATPAPGPGAAELHSALAVAFLRLGEQQNCLERHDSDSCLFPIREAGRHRVEEGSRRAMAELERVLAESPGDLTARWLLNLAAMTVGEYPAGVPEGLRIPETAFRSEHDVGRFPDVAPSAGLAAVGLAGGSAVDDFDGDGLLDVLSSSWGSRDPLRLFLNNGDGTFTDRAREAGLEGIGGGLNLVHADYDNDGDNDVFVLRGAWLGPLGRQPNSLLRNEGDGRFTDVTVRAGLADLAPTQTAAWGDYDDDGRLDLFVGAESLGSDRYPCRLYRNQGDGTFRDVAAELGVVSGGFVKGAVWGDVDNDGRPDLYLSRLQEPNQLFLNQGPAPEGAAGGPWRPFAEVGGAAGVSEPEVSFPAWFFDYDNDGWLDLFVAGYEIDYLEADVEAVIAHLLGRRTTEARPRLYRNAGDGTFADVTTAAGLDRPLYAMGANFGDLENDGFLDFYLGTGTPSLTALVPNVMLRNEEGRRFRDVTTAGGFGHLQKGHGVSFADLDNDGDQDVHVVLGGAFSGDVYQNALFLNPGHGNRWITLRLEGVRANRSAIGARIRLEVDTPAGPRTIHRAVSTGGSFGSGSLQQEIGLGSALRVRSVQIRWPGTGRPQTLGTLGMDRIWKIREGAPPEPVDVPVLDLGRGRRPAGPAER